MTFRVVVVGGGITGLAAAVWLRRHTSARISIIEGSQQLGGKLRTTELADRVIEAGAESLLMRRPEAREFAESLGLTLRPAEQTHAGIWLDGAITPMPRGTIMGLPGDLDALAASGMFDRGALQAIQAEPGRPGDRIGLDADLAELVRSRFGIAAEPLLTNLIEPLLGGVYAGSAAGISVAATVPAVATRLREDPSLVRAAQHVLKAGKPGPMFATVTGGLSQLVSAAVAELGPNTEIHYGQPVRQVQSTPEGWRISIGSAAAPRYLTADAVVLATPATATSRLLKAVAPAAATELAEIDYASVALVGLVLPALPLPELSGVLVPAKSGLATKAITFVDNKWGGRADHTVIRASLGRYSDTAVLRDDDSQLIARVRSELATVLGRELPAHQSAAVFRWGGALPQYVVGHQERISRVRAALATVPSLALAGAAYDGVGIAACIASGQRAGAAVASVLSNDATGLPPATGHEAQSVS